METEEIVPQNVQKKVVSKKVLFGIALSFIAVAAIVLAVGSDKVYGITGFFTKAFDKSLGAGEYYERNITVRVYYNLSVRFQKEGSTSYLSFDDNRSVVVLKDAGGNEILRSSGVKNGRIYVLLNASQVQAVAAASAYNISDYADVVGQAVNVSYSGTSAYVTIVVAYRAAMITGYVVDDLTGGFVGNVSVLALEDGADPQTAATVVQNTSDAGGKYRLTLQLDSSRALDVYVEGYDVA